MKNIDKKEHHTNRRDFLAKSLQACAIGCIGYTHISASNSNKDVKQEEDGTETKHKFDSEFKRTYRTAYLWKYSSYIAMMKEMSVLMGEDELIKKIKNSVENKNMRNAKDGSGFSLVNWAEEVENSSGFKITNTITFPVKTENKLEIRCTECLWADTFKKRNAGNIGFATVCYGDYSLFRALHPKLILKRDKTLMQGHDCCNGTLSYEV